MLWIPQENDGTLLKYKPFDFNTEFPFPPPIFLLHLNCCLENRLVANGLYSFQLQNSKKMFEIPWHFYVLLQQWSQGKNVFFNQVFNCCLI